MATKSTDAEIEERVLTVYEMIIKGATRPFIIRYSSEKWDVSSRTVDKYISLATNKIREQATQIQNDLFEKTIVRLEDLYRKNYTIEDFRECRQIASDFRKLFGLDEPAKTDITTNGESINIISLGNGTNPDEPTD